MKIMANMGVNQKGFTIVEILVAIVISMILLMGVINIFLASKQSYTLQSGMSRLQENARFALDMMASSITVAGSDTGTADVLPFTAITADGGGNVSDTISVQYASPTDCLGANTAGNPTPGVATDTFAITAQSELTCNGTVIVEGIDNMQILYGIDTTKTVGMGDVITNVDGVPESFVPYNSLPASFNVPPDDADEETGGITSVRVALLVSSVRDPNAGGTVQGDINNTLYTLLDAPQLPAFNDRRIRRVYSRTILLRNYVVQPKNPSY